MEIMMILRMKDFNIEGKCINGFNICQDYKQFKVYRTV